MSKERKRFVKISSTMDIEVYGNLASSSFVSESASGKTLNTSAIWPYLSVKFHVGQGWYPSMILDWKAVKALDEKEILTIGEQKDTIDNVEMLAKAEKMEKKLKTGLQRMNAEKVREKETL